jgi:hypothetical protein
MHSPASQTVPGRARPYPAATAATVAHAANGGCR